VMHMCCGYPGHLDDENYLKADPACYRQLARAVDASSVQQVSIEDAHCLNDLELLEHFTRTAVILGVVTIASSRIESSDYIAQRLRRALQHIDRSRLLAAPDCGLMMLGRELQCANSKTCVPPPRRFESPCKAAYKLTHQITRLAR